MSDMDYCNMLITALEKKVDLLDLLLKRTREQSAILQDVASTSQALDENIALKAELIESIGKLDEGFELLFARVKDTIAADTITYFDQIKRMQELIRKITDLSADIEAQELKNKDYARSRYALGGKNTVTVKKSSEKVSQYYKTMMEATKSRSQSLDKRK